LPKPDAPLHVAEVVAELWQGRTIPFPDRPGSYITLALDAYGTVMMQPENLTAMLDAATA
jgi:hypothetical protein